MAAVQHDGDVSGLLRHLVDQQGEFLVGQVPLIVARHPAVVAHQRFVQMVRFQRPELFGCLFLGTVSAEIEQHRIIRAGPGQMLSEAVHDGLTRRLLILQNLEAQPRGGLPRHAHA